MAEAFVVLGIAANIAQFIGYGLQLLSDGKEIYNSLHGERDEHHVLEAIVEDIRNLSNEAKPLSAQSEDEIALRKLATECDLLADRLTAILNDLKVPKDTRFRRLKTVQQTIRSAAKKRDIQDLKRKLIELDARLRTRASRMLQQ
jgi:chromosome segregation ATPase